MDRDVKASVRARWSLRRLLRRPSHLRARRFGARGRLAVALLSGLTASAGWFAHGSATFNATTANGADASGTATFGTATSLPTYPGPIRDSTWASYQQQVEPPSAAATLAARAAPGKARAGTTDNGVLTGPVVSWKFDENAGNSAADSSGEGNAGTLVNSPTRTAGEVGSAVHLNGANQYVVGARAAVNTSTSFSVSAWARLAAKGGVNRTVVAQDGTHISGFFLQYVNSGDTWALVRRPNDGHPAGPPVMAKDTSPVTLDTWYHLLGVYDSGAQQIKLYVNGALKDTQSFSTPWNAAGALTVGRAKWNGRDADFFPGRIDEVRVFQRALTATEARSLAAGLRSRTEGLRVRG
jgi:hypothetical protein